MGTGDNLPILDCSTLLWQICANGIIKLDLSKLCEFCIKTERTRPSALGMSDPVIESQEIKETQEFPSILKMLKGAKKTKGAKGVKGTMRNSEKW